MSRPSGSLCQIVHPGTTAAMLALVCSIAAAVIAQQAKPEDTDQRPFTDRFVVEHKDFASTGSNPYFVLEPGYVLVLAGEADAEPAELTITVLDETRTIAGVETRVVEERETRRGALIEVSRNYFAICRRTDTIYYFGEDVDMYQDGKVVGHGGSWHAGEGNARYGVMMPGTVLLGARYYQEIAPAVAMDRAEVVSLDATLETAAGRFDHCLKVEESTPLEPGVKEFKVYGAGIGLLADGALKLVKFGRK
ncbi:MAG: hypothetical protein U1E76_22840 [Planctomycetota bacterium]